VRAAAADQEKVTLRVTFPSPKVTFVFPRTERRTAAM
jgi:hypothetical protein